MDFVRRKLVITNGALLAGKYGERAADVIAALDALARADAAGGLQHIRLDLSSLEQMKALGLAAITKPDQRRAVKVAVDAAYARHRPHFVLVIGGPQILPHQRWRAVVDDADQANELEGDLPYASGAPFSDDIQDFLPPARHVGRLPDLHAAQEPGHLVQLILHAAGHRSRPASDMRKALVVSSLEWSRTTWAATAFLGLTRERFTTPPTEAPLKGPTYGWSTRDLARPVHVHNLHSAKHADWFMGRSAGKSDWTMGLTSREILERVPVGVVAVAEACYGAFLGAQSKPRGLGIGAAYLASGAAAYLGSTCRSYGGTAARPKPRYADLLCRHFVGHVLHGRTVGEALLRTQRELARRYAPEPKLLKTLAQFLLLGDPSARPVVAGLPLEERADGEPPRSDARDEAIALDRLLAHAEAEAAGRTMGRLVPVEPPMAPGIRRELERAMGEAGFAMSKVRSFVIEPHGRLLDEARTRRLPKFVHCAQGRRVVAGTVPRPEGDEYPDEIWGGVDLWEVDGETRALVTSVQR